VTDPLALPDEPRWVEAHGITGDPAGWRRALGTGFAVGHDAARLVVIAEGSDGVAALATEYPQHAFLVTTEVLAAELRDVALRRPVRAILHTLPDPAELPDLEGAMPLADDAPLEHLPAPLAEELGRARGDGRPIWAAHVDGAPVSFAYAPWRSARWFDVSVDTIATARQLGLATLTAAAMIRHERAAGREPVWGADEDNVASLRLAKRLGFVAVDEIWVAPP
jgi:GNAT acetyltransferase